MEQASSALVGDEALQEHSGTKPCKGDDRYKLFV